MKGTLNSEPAEQHRVAQALGRREDKAEAQRHQRNAQQHQRQPPAQLRLDVVRQRPDQRIQNGVGAKAETHGDPCQDAGKPQHLGVVEKGQRQGDIEAAALHRLAQAIGGLDL